MWKSSCCPTGTACNCIIFLLRRHNQSGTQYSMKICSGVLYNGITVLFVVFFYSFANNSQTTFLTTVKHWVTSREVTHGFKISFLTDYTFFRLCQIRFMFFPHVHYFAVTDTEIYLPLSPCCVIPLQLCTISLTSVFPHSWVWLLWITLHPLWTLPLQLPSFPFPGHTQICDLIQVFQILTGPY